MNNSLKKAISSLLLITLVMSGCEMPFKKDEPEKITREPQQKEKIQRFIVQEVEIFDLATENAKLAFTKNGTLQSADTISIAPEITGKITDINVQVGQKVNRGDLLATLGNSLSTESLDLQYANAQRSLEISKQSREVARDLTDRSIYGANLGVTGANQAYNNATANTDNTLDIIEEQREGLKIALEFAEENYDRARDTRSDARKALDEAEEKYNDYMNSLSSNVMPDVAFLGELEAAIAAAQAQLDAAEIAVDNADISRDQAQNALDQFKQTSESQINGSSFGAESSYTQLLSAQNQAETAEISQRQQLLNIESQITQAEAALESAALSRTKKTLTSPISGTITEISIDESSFVNPGQKVMTIKTLDRLVTKTSINAQERELISVGESVKVTVNGQRYDGEIIEISPSLNDVSKKIDLEIAIYGANYVVPGDFAEVEFKPQVNNVFIPLNSVFLLNNEKYVKTVNERKKIEYTKIETGTVVGNYIEIKSGLNGKEKIVTNQSQFLKENEIVKIASVK